MFQGIRKSSQTLGIPSNLPLAGLKLKIISNETSNNYFVIR